VARVISAKSSPKQDDKTPAPQSWRELIKIHPAADLFPLMSKDELVVLGHDILENGLKTPIAMWAAGDNEAHEKFMLLDGRNRLDAMELAGWDTVEQDTEGAWKIKEHLGGSSHLALGGRGGSPVVYLYEYQAGLSMPLGSPGKAKKFRKPGVDPWQYVHSVNIARRHLMPKLKRDLISKLVKANPSKSDRAIGKMAKADNKTVASVRSEMEGREEIPHVKTRTDTRGRATPAKKSASKSTAAGSRSADDHAPAKPVSSNGVSTRSLAPADVESPSTASTAVEPVPVAATVPEARKPSLVYEVVDRLVEVLSAIQFVDAVQELTQDERKALSGRVDTARRYLGQLKEVLTPVRPMS
jgi:hypothetical protein